MARSRKSHRKPHRKSPRKTSRKSSRKSHRKSPRKSRTHRLTKKQFRSLKLGQCRSRTSEFNCERDPNCSWNSAKKHCYKGKRLVYQGPSLPVMY